MSKKRELERFYPGDELWAKYVEACSDGWGNCPFKKELVAALNAQADVAKVVFFLIGESSLSWIRQSIPALDDLSPTECLVDVKLNVRFKSMLMRMHA